ncbi:DUF92 domain-containing protein [Mucilaginibacter sp. RS28]|uniref:DUF92 domain-containing protein n=1 Tax=Mucilaginibacter straminoryzae TaxID=2932774 RepID=A0A9X1WYZ8_9SPHI|nr:DUF92 domain-containing protein [Mucilaginibacter straminoryzae]
MHFPVYVFLAAAAIWSSLRRKLTPLGSMTGFIVGALVFAATGAVGLTMLAVFFAAGTLATSIGKVKKQQLAVAEGDNGRRTAGQVLANGGVAALCGGIALAMPDQQATMLLMVAGSLASATADTLSSELGTLHGKRFYNILSFKKDIRGADGVVSLEGTLIGVAGASLIALIYACKAGFDSNVIRIIIAGTLGNMTDSILGAALERKHKIGNNLVNFLNTLSGALFCWLLSRLL